MISFVIAVRNNASQLSVCLESLFSQQAIDQSFEVLVADGGSTDSTLEVLQSYSKRLAWWESAPDQGVYDAWNKALNHARGEWICFLGSDDFLCSKHIVSKVTPLLSDAYGLNRLLVYGPCNLFSWKKGKVLGTYNPRPDELRRSLRTGRFILHAGSFQHRELLHDFGPKFDASYKIAGDYALLLKYLVRHEPAYLPFPVVNMGTEGMSLGRSFSFNLRSTKENLRAYRETFDGFPWRIYLRFLYKLFK